MHDGRASVGARLGEPDFDGSPYRDLPPRKHARREIPSERDGWGEPVPPSRRRRLSAAERKALQERRQQREEPLPRPERRVARAAVATGASARQAFGSRATTRRGLTLGGLVIVALTLLAFAAGRLMSSDATNPPTPTPKPAPIVALNGDTPTVVPVIASPGTATPAATPGLAFNSHDGKRVVCIDPGHGGPDTGYVRLDDGNAPAAQEKDLNLIYAEDLASRLSEDGIKVVMTRVGDYAVNRSNLDMNHNGKIGQYGSDEWDLDELQARIDVCNRANADLLISVHINGFPDTSARGFEVWYTRDRPFGAQSQYLAQQINQDLKVNMQNVGYEGPDRGAQDDINANVQNGKDKFTAQHYVIIGPEIPDKIKPPSLMPGVICEPIFISNDNDANFAMSQDGQNAIVSAYEQAVLTYFQKYPG